MTKIIGFFKLMFVLGILLFLEGCVNTPEDAMDQYRLFGLDSYVEDMVNYSDNSPVYTQVFNDSIFPILTKEISFVHFAELSDKVKNHSTYKNFIEAEISDGYIKTSLSKMKPEEACRFYKKYHKTFKSLDRIYGSILANESSKRSFTEILAMNDLLLQTPLQNTLTKYSYSKDDVLNLFKSINIIDGAKTYRKYHRAFPIIDTVYRERVLPILINAPYETLKDVSTILKGNDFSPSLKAALQAARSEYLLEIKNEVDNHRDVAIEALDRMVIPSIQLELDSLSLADAKTVTNKFIGGFLNIRKLALTFGRDETKFKKIWDKHIHSEKYDEVFDKHIKGLLDEVSTSQQKLYTQITGIGRKRVVYSYMSDPILIQYPKDSRLIQDYIKSNKFGYIKSIAEWLPYIGDAIMINDGYEMLTDKDTKKEKLEDKEAFKLFCQCLIVGQIDESYFDHIRTEAIKVIDHSYNNLYSDISKKI